RRIDRAIVWRASLSREEGEGQRTAPLSWWGCRCGCRFASCAGGLSRRQVIRVRLSEFYCGQRTHRNVDENRDREVQAVSVVKFFQRCSRVPVGRVLPTTICWRNVARPAGTRLQGL